MLATRLLSYLLVGLAGLAVLPWDPNVIPGPMLRDESPTEADQPQRTAQYTRDIVYFPCSGVKCQAWLYQPTQAAGSKPPVIVAAHGLGAQKDFGLAAYGERFAKAGLASFIFDYRSFGGSEGEPRHWVSPKRHLEDWQSAIEYVQSQLADSVDTSKLMLWGTSFGGGHALTTAGKMGRNITAVVAQVPFIDGKASFNRNIKERGLVRIARAVFAGLHDTLRSFFSYPAAYYNLVGLPGSWSFMPMEQDELDAYYAKHPPTKQGGWKNMGRCKLALEASAYRPILYVPNITAPVMYAAATKDKLCPLDGVQAAVKATPNALLVTVDTNHFSVYSGEPLETLITHYINFYRATAGLPADAGAAAAAEPGPPAAAAAGEQAAADEGQQGHGDEL